MPDRVKPSFVIFDIRANRRSAHGTARQIARMSKITNDGLTRSETGCFIAVPIWQQWASKGQMPTEIYAFQMRIFQSDRGVPSSTEWRLLYSREVHEMVTFVFNPCRPWSATRCQP